MSNAVINGPEPKALDYTQLELRGTLMRNLNWYSYEKDRRDALAYVRAYLKKTDPKSVQTWDRIDANLFVPTFGWIARMILQGSTFDERTLQRLQDHIADCLHTTVAYEEPEVVAPAVTNKKSIQAAMAEKQAEFLGEVEGEVDNFIVNGYKPTGYSLYKYCQSHNVAKQYMAAVDELYTKRIDEIKSIGSDDQITEAYAHLGRRSIKSYLDFLQSLIDDAQKYASFKKANRKPRAKKQKPAGEQVAKLKYLKNFEALNLESLHPANMVGAQQVWVYNTKNRKLGVYHATGASGFSVKGSSLQGWDPEASVQRTLRKPEVVIPAMMKAGKVQLRRILSDLSTTETPLNGRFNEDIMILRIV
jgi:hypothetical protein